MKSSSSPTSVREIDASWSPRPRDPELRQGEVHVWLVDLDLEVIFLPKFLRDLSLTERAKAQGFRFEHDRRRYVVSKGTLRRILASYLLLEPHEVEFVTGPWGKPELSSRLRTQHGRLAFNQAHSGSLGIYTFSWNRRVGVDVEEIRPLGNLEQTAELFFTPEELSHFRSLPEEEKRGAFFNGWTRKEAFVKALGEGLSRPLNNFDVLTRPGETRTILRHPGPTESPVDWSLQEIPISSRYAAALCVEGQDWKLHRWK